MAVIALGRALAARPGTVVGLVLIGVVFGFGLLAPLGLAFPLLGFLIVFDSVFSLGTQVNASTIVVLGFSASNPLVVAMTARLLADAGLHRQRLSTEGLWIGGTVFFGAILSSYVSTGGFTRSAATYMGAGMVVLVVLSYGSAALVRRMLLGVCGATLLAAASGLLGVLSASGGTPQLGRAINLIGKNQISVPRVSGLYQNPDALAFALLAGLFAGFASIRSRPLRWAMVAIVCPILLLTYGRGPIAGVALGVFAYAILRRSRARSISLGGAHTDLKLFTISLFAGAGLLLAIIIWAGRTPALARFWNGQSVTFRLQIARVALETWQSNPVLGIGPGQFLARFFVEAHDTFLQVGAEMGVIGFVPVMSLYMLALMRSARRALTAESPEEARSAAWLSSGVVGVAVVAATLTLLGVKEMWVFLAAAALPLSGGTRTPRPAFDAANLYQTRSPAKRHVV